MKPTRLFLLTALGLSLALGACSAPRTGLLKLYQRNSGEMFSLRVGETMEVLFDAEPGTDIHWSKVPGAPEILEQIGGTEYEPDLETHNAERRLITRFRAIAPGRTRLQLNYRLPAQDARVLSGGSSDIEFEVWVVVKEKE